MSNTRCGCTQSRPLQPTPKVHYEIHQMEKLNDVGEKFDIFPNTLVQAVYDIETGESLKELLQKSNHVALSFNTDFETTVKQVPTSQRRRGLIVTFVNCSGKIKHYQYNGCNTEYVNFANRTNWSEFPSITEEDWQKIRDSEVFFKPTGLSYNPHTKSLDFTYVDKQNVVHTLCTPLNLEDTWHKIESLKISGNNLILTQRNSNGSVQEFSVALPQAVQGKGNVVTVQAPTTGRCGSKTPQTITYTDTYITAVRVEGNNLILERNDSTELGVELPNNPKSTTDSPTRAEFDTLKGIVEELPTCDCEDLKSQIRGLVQRIEALEARPQPQPTVDTNKYVVRGEWVDENTIRLHFNDNTYVDITKPNTPTVEPKKPITLSITASNTTGVGSVRPNISVTGTEGDEPITEPISLTVNGQPYDPNKEYIESTELVVVATYKDKVVEERVPIRVTPVSYTLTASSSKPTITRGDNHTIIPRLESNKPNLGAITYRVDGNPYTDQPLTPNETKEYLVEAYEDGVKVAETRVRVVVNEPTSLYKIKYGFLKSSDPDQKPTIENLTREMEVESLAGEGVIIPIPTEAPSRGRYIYAIEKPLIANGYKAYMKFNGGWSLLTEEETEKSDVQIEGKDYTLYIDYLTNREFTDPLDIKVTD